MFLFKQAKNISKIDHPDQFQPGENDWKDILVGIKTICASDPNCTIYEDYVSRNITGFLREYPNHKDEVPYLKVSVKRGLVEYMQVFSLFTHGTAVGNDGNTYLLIGLKQNICIWKYNDSISPYYVEDQDIHPMKFPTSQALTGTGVIFSIHDGHTFLCSDYKDYTTGNQVTRFTAVYSIQNIYPEDTNPNIGLFIYDSSKEFVWDSSGGFVHRSCIKPNNLQFLPDTRRTLVCGAYDMFGQALHGVNGSMTYRVDSERYRIVLGSIVYRRLEDWQPDDTALVGNIRNILVTPGLVGSTTLGYFMDVGGILYSPRYIPPQNLGEPAFNICVCVGSNRL